MAQNFLVTSRHGTVFYFRRRVPNDLRAAVNKPYIVKSLQTTLRPVALVRARMLASKTDVLFATLRNMKNKEPAALQADYTLSFDFDENHQIKSARVEATPDEEVSADAVASAIKSALGAPPRPAPELVTVEPETLYEDFFREGVGVSKWKNPEQSRRHNYDPIWKTFLPFATEHGLTKKASQAYRDHVLALKAANKTKISYLSAPHAVLSHGVKRFDLAAGILEPLKSDGLKKGAKNPYLPFTRTELELLFHSDAYQNNSFAKPSQFWAPLILLYTGARLDEVGALHLSVFREDEGVPYMVLSCEVTTDGGKNEYAPRDVPLHQNLIDCGLLEYVEFLRKAGHKRLFPELRPAQKGGFAKRVGDDFCEYRRSVNVGSQAGERSRQVAHSFRASMSGKLLEVGIDSDLSRMLTGHAPVDVHQRVYLATARIPLTRAVKKLNEVDFGLNHPKFSDTAAYQKARRRKHSTPE